MGVKVCKFGGSSVADASCLRRVKAIVEADASRQVVVTSAPGKRTQDDRKITDLLYLCSEQVRQRGGFEEVYGLIRERYEQITGQLGLSLDMEARLKEVRDRIAAGASPAEVASRGEYLSGLLLAELLGFEFVDAAQIICFDANGELDAQRTHEAAADRLLGRCAVVPGYYGAMPDGTIRTFSRGGSDVTGAILARAVGAEIYENWTDVPGLFMADPQIVKDPKPIACLTYRELRELSYMGARVLHDEAIFPVRTVGIPVNVRCTTQPDHPGTRIVRDTGQPPSGAITGIAGRKDFTIIALEKTLMNTEVGFGWSVLGVLRSHGVSFEHMPSGIDTLSLVIADHQLDGKLDRVVEDLRAECRPDGIEVYPDMALVATVGRGMMRTPGTASRLFDALAGAGVNVRMIDQGSSELNIIVGVEAHHFEEAVRAIYAAFV